jgi:hypothetical protein
MFSTLDATPNRSCEWGSLQGWYHFTSGAYRNHWWRGRYSDRSHNVDLARSHSGCRVRLGEPITEPIAPAEGYATHPVAIVVRNFAIPRGWGVNLDSQTVSPGEVHSTLYWSPSSGALFAGDGVLVAFWTSASAPTDSECRELTATQPILSGITPRQSVFPPLRAASLPFRSHKYRLT